MNKNTASVILLTQWPNSTINGGERQRETGRESALADTHTHTHTHTHLPLLSSPLLSSPLPFILPSPLGSKGHPALHLSLYLSHSVSLSLSPSLSLLSLSMYISRRASL